MQTYLVTFLLSALCSVVLTPVVRNLAVAWGLVDSGDEARKVHDRPIPRVGGVAIAIAFFVPVVGLFLWDNAVSQAYVSRSGRVVGLIGGSVAMVSLGLVDDLRGLRARHKLLVQIAVAVGAWALGYQIIIIANPFGAPLVLGWFGFPITVLWIVGIVNAFNLIDGLDGLATGIALITVSILFVLGVLNESIIPALTAVALGGALLGFLRYNFNPASVFMGDSGSLFIGYVLAITAISGSSKSSTVVSLLIPLLAMGVPVADTLISLLRRVLGGRNPFEADRGHLHHRLLDRGLTHRDAVLVIYTLTSFLALGSLMLVYANSLQSAVVLSTLIVVSVGSAWATGMVSWTDIRRSVRYGLLRQRSLRERLRASVDAGAAIREATSIEGVIGALIEHAAGLDIDLIALDLQVGVGEEAKRWSARWPAREPGSRASFHRLEYPLDWSLGQTQLAGTLAFAWDCPPEQIQIPDAPTLDWLAMVLRDQVLEITAEPGAQRFRPRIAGDH